MGSVEPLKRLHARWGETVHFVDVLVRQVHPGPEAPPYRRDSEKVADAEAYRRIEGIAWTVLVDDVAGTVHQAYGALTNPAYLVGTDGRVAFYAPTTGAPVLDRAIQELLAAGGRGVVAGGRDIVPHLLAAFTDGWRAIERGVPQSAAELSSAAPGSVALLRLGRRLRPVLAPLTLRAEPLSRRAALAMMSAVIGVLLLAARRRRGGVDDKERHGGTVRTTFPWPLLACSAWPRWWPSTSWPRWSSSPTGSGPEGARRSPITPRRPGRA